MAKKLIITILLLLLLCCLSLALGIWSASRETDLSFRGYYGYSIAYEPGEGEPPGGGSCNNVGLIYGDNPFAGFPVDYQIGDLESISFGYCAPYPDGTPHWGIDIGGNGVDGANILLTTTRAIVRQANSCPGSDECWNYGMGRMVQVEAQIPVDDYDECVSLQNGDTEHAECWADTGWRATYMHLSEVHVSVNQIVHRSDVLGKVGATGNTLIAHLYYQINSDVEVIDPTPTLLGG